MNTKENKLASKLLDMASDVFSNHGCNDLDSSFLEGWTEEELSSLNKEMHDWNNSPKEDYEDCMYDYDHVLMSFLAFKLKEEK